jgi:Tol biopolymer transport system component
VISILDIPTGEERQVVPKIDSIRPNDGPRWAPDGRSVLVIGTLGEENGIFKVDVETGATSPLAIIPPYQYTLHAVWSHDGRSLFYPQGNPTRILRHDLDTGKITALAAMTGPAGIPVVSVSPDGKWLAFTSWEDDERRIQLKILPLGGGEARELFRAEQSELIMDVLWTPDGRSLWFRKITPSKDPKMPPRWESWRVGLDGEGPRKLGLSVPGGGIRLHPDGRKIAFATGRSRYDLWVMENFLPAGKK